MTPWGRAGRSAGGGQTSSARPLIAAVVLLLIAVGFGVATAATPNPSPPSLGTSTPSEAPTVVVSSLDAGPGETITIAGTGCPGADAGTPVGRWTAQVWLDPAPGEGTPPASPEPTATVAPDTSGSWWLELVVPDGAGDWRLETACFDDANPPHGFVYLSPEPAAGGN